MTKMTAAIGRIAGTVEDACGVPCRVLSLDCADSWCSGFCEKCYAAQEHKAECDSLLLMACYQAERWGGRYEFLCRAGCAFVASPVLHDGEHEYGILAGPFIMVDAEDFLAGEYSELFHGGERKLAARLPYYPARRVPALGEMLFMLCSYIQSREVLDLQVMESSLSSKNEIYSAIDELKRGARGADYPIEAERKLKYYITAGNRAAAQHTLNDILGYIYFASAGIAEQKQRIAELMVLLSRAAIEGGASVSEVFGMTGGLFEQIRSFNDMDELSEWLAKALIRFTGAVFAVTDSRHSEIIKRVMEYVRENYTRRITLNDISAHVNFSVSYLSRLFKEETGETLSTYINRVRIERSKVLLTNNDIPLIEVAYMCGFEDQSYFNRVFKKLAGVTPGRFREKLGKI